MSHAEVPRIPVYAWSWLQRSRDVLNEVAVRLMGELPGPGFVDQLRRVVPVDPFIWDVVLQVICEQAFNGRPPPYRPRGVSWDRGLVWWAATLSGMTSAEFEAASAGPSPTQQRLFGPEPEPAPAPPAAPSAIQWRPRPTERVALARALRELLTEADGEHVPASAVRRLLRELER